MFVGSDMVELKSMVVSDICKEIIAFANTRGGALYIGVADDGNVVGVDDADKVILQLNHMVRDSVKPDVTMFVRYEAQAKDGRTIVAVTVQKGTDRPYYLGSKGLKPGGVYVRNGTSCDPASDVAIRKMIKETDGDSFESMRSLEQSLTFKAAEARFAQKNIPFDMAKMQTLGMITKDGVYSNVAMLLSDQCNISVKTATFSGTDKSVFRDRREFTGSLFAQLEDVYAYLDLRNRTKATFSGLYRTDKRDYPEEALREALMNALVHRDYAYSAGTLISVYEDRIEFVSVGGLPDGISLEDVMLGLSVCRNPKLAAVFYQVKLIEAYGTGIPKIMQAYKGSGVTPTIEATANAFRITLPNRNAGSEEAPVERVPLSDDEKPIMGMIESRGFVTRSDVEALFQISQPTASRILRRMLERGLILREGKGRNMRYIRKP